METAIAPVADRIRSFIGEAEGPELEFKISVPDPRQLSQIIAAFANTNGGMLIVGVREPAQIIGCDVGHTTRQYESALKYIHPKVETDIHDIDIDGRSVVAILVPAMSELVMASGGAFVRIGASIKAMTRTDIMARIQESQSHSAIQDVAQAITEQTDLILSLQSELRSAQSLKSKAWDYFIGGLVGAVLGIILTALFL